jgi:hypothetical protein
LAAGTHLTAFCLKRNTYANQVFLLWAAWLGTVSILPATSSGFIFGDASRAGKTKRRQSRERLSDIHCALRHPGRFMVGGIFPFSRGIRIDSHTLAPGRDFADRTFCPEKSYPVGHCVH